MSATLLVSTREYIDLDFSFARHPITSNVSIKKTINAVKQSILHLMQLKESDKPFHPEIKSPVYQYFFENASAITAIIIESEVKKYLGTYEPRVAISSVNVTFPEANAITCEIVGEIINIQTPITVNVLINRLR
jgi:phage baseplate assembly protein W